MVYSKVMDTTFGYCSDDDIIDMVQYGAIRTYGPYRCMTDVNVNIEGVPC